MNSAIYFVCIILLIVNITALPSRRKCFHYEDYGDNSVLGGDGIDISSLGPKAYGLPKSESGDAVANWSESSLMNPEEVSGYAEGDILMPPQQTRNGVRAQTFRWPNGHIPYVIEGDYTEDQRDTIMKAIADFHRLTCLHFVPHEGQKDYVAIQSKNIGCLSAVGRIGGRQEVNLQAPGCTSKKDTVIHELLHAVGFMHEQNRAERDDFVTVRYENIMPDDEVNFCKADMETTNDFSVPYDYNSVLHYSEYASSKNQQKTLEAKVGGVKLGQRMGLSRGDVRKINRMYNCNYEEPELGWVDDVYKGIFGDR